MSENQLMLIYFAVFCCLSFLILRVTYKLKSWTLWIIVPLYLFGILAYYGGVDSLNDEFKGTEYYIDWGHASIGMLVMMVPSLFIGVVSVAILLYLKLFKRRKY